MYQDQVPQQSTWQRIAQEQQIPTGQGTDVLVGLDLSRRMVCVLLPISNLILRYLGLLNSSIKSLNFTLLLSVGLMRWFREMYVSVLTDIRDLWPGFVSLISSLSLPPVLPTAPLSAASASVMLAIRWGMASVSGLVLITVMTMGLEYVFAMLGTMIRVEYVWRVNHAQPTAAEMQPECVSATPVTPSMGTIVQDVQKGRYLWQPKIDVFVLAG